MANQVDSVAEPYPSPKTARESPSGGRWREEWRAGFIGKKCNDDPYDAYRCSGPVVQVWFDDNFVSVSTDDYEGTAMFLRENLDDVIAILLEVKQKISSETAR